AGRDHRAAVDGGALVASVGRAAHGVGARRDRTGTGWHLDADAVEIAGSLPAKFGHGFREHQDKKMRAWLLGLFGLLLAEVAAADPPSIAAFLNYAKYETVKVSPHGTYLALTRRDSEHEILTVLTLPDLKLAGQTHFGSLTDIERLEWANDRRMLV